MSDLLDKKKLEIIHEVDEQFEALQENVQGDLINEIPQELEEERLRARIEQGHELRDRLKNSVVMSNNTFSETMIPMDAELHSEYRNEYQEKKLVKSRESKIKNKKSRLYSKDQVAKRFEATDAEEFKVRDARAKMRRHLPPAQRVELKCDELNDLSILATELAMDEMQYEDNFASFVKSYTGVMEDGSKADAAEIEKGRFTIMSEIANVFMSQPAAEVVNLFDDKVLAAKSDDLERMSRLLKVFKNMMKNNPGFMEALKAKEGDGAELAGGETAEKLEKQIERLTAIDDVYRVRKLIVTNPYYRTHYNDELSMNVEANDEPQKKYLSKLLRTQYYLGKNLQRIMGEGSSVGYPKAELAEGNEYMKKFEGEVKKISKDATDAEGNSVYNRKNVDDMLRFLEHEKGCMPPADMMFSLKEVTGIKPKSMAHALSGNTSIAGCKFLAEVEGVNPAPSPEKIKRDKLIDECIKPFLNGGVHISVRSKKLHNHDGGDSIARQTDILKGTLCDTMTDEEVAEMIDNLMHSYKLRNATDKDHDMADDMYLNGYAKYMSIMHQKLKMSYNILGDKLESIRPEDWVRVMSDPKMSDLLILSIFTSSNMDVNLPYEFLKKYSDIPVDHLKDFDLLSKGISSLGIKADVFRVKTEEVLCEGDDFKKLKQELEEDYEKKKSAYDELVAANAWEDQIENASKQMKLADKKSNAVKGLSVMQLYDKPEEYIKLKNLTDEYKDDISEGVIEANKIHHIDMMIGGFLALKRSKYWDYNTTSNEEKTAYQKKCDDMGYIGTEMDITKYDTTELKEMFKYYLKLPISMNEKAELYGLGESETAKEYLELLKRVWKEDLGFPETEFDDLYARVKAEDEEINSLTKQMKGNKV